MPTKTGDMSKKEREVKHGEELCEKANKIFALQMENERLQRILDSRPAINAGLVEAYIEWSQGIYQCDVNQVIGHNA